MDLQKVFPVQAPKSLGAKLDGISLNIVSVLLLVILTSIWLWDAAACGGQHQKHIDSQRVCAVFKHWMPLKIRWFYWGCLRRGGIFFPLLKDLFKEQQQQTTQATSCGSMTSSSRLSPRCAGQRSSKGICRCTNTLLGLLPVGNHCFTEGWFKQL